MEDLLFKTGQDTQRPLGPSKISQTQFSVHLFQPRPLHSAGEQEDKRLASYTLPSLLWDLTFSFCFVLDKLHVSAGLELCYIVKDNLELLIFMPLPSEY